MLEYLFAEPGSHCPIDFVHPTTGRGVYSGDTLDTMRQRYPHAEIVATAEWQRRRGAEQDSPVSWSEVRQERYDDAFGALFPAAIAHNGFQVGEAEDHHAVSGEPRFRSYIRRDGKYWESSRPMTIAEFHAFVARA